jgi:hypothetical protein
MATARCDISSGSDVHVNCPYATSSGVQLGNHYHAVHGLSMREAAEKVNQGGILACSKSGIGRFSTPNHPRTTSRGGRPRNTSDSRESKLIEAITAKTSTGRAMELVSIPQFMVDNSQGSSQELDPLPITKGRVKKLFSENNIHTSYPDQIEHDRVSNIKVVRTLPFITRRGISVILTNIFFLMCITSLK